MKLIDNIYSAFTGNVTEQQYKDRVNTAQSAASNTKYTLDKYINSLDRHQKTVKAMALDVYEKAGDCSEYKILKHQYSAEDLQKKKLAKEKMKIGVYQLRLTTPQIPQTDLEEIIDGMRTIAKVIKQTEKKDFYNQADGIEEDILEATERGYMTQVEREQTYSPSEVLMTIEDDFDREIKAELKIKGMNSVEGKPATKSVTMGQTETPKIPELELI